MPDSSASCGGHAGALADRAHALEHARGPACVDRRRRVALELALEQRRDEAVVARGAVVGRDLGVPQQLARRARGRRRGSRAAPSRGRPRAPARPGGSPAARCRRRRPRGSPAGAPLAGRVEARGRRGPPPTAARPRPARTAAACRGRRPRAGTASSPSSWRATEKARARNGRSSSPPPQRSAAASIANWPGAGAGPSGSETVMHAVDAELADLGDLERGGVRAAPAPPRAARLTPRRRRRRPRRARRRPTTPPPRRAASAARDARAGRRRPPPRRAPPRRRRAADAVEVLQAHHLRLAVDPRPRDRARRRHPGRERRQARHAVGDGRAADLVPVGAGADPGRRVDHEVHVAAFDPVDDVRRALADLVQPLHRHAHARRSPPPCRAWRRSGSPRRGATARSRRRPPCLRR